MPKTKAHAAMNNPKPAHDAPRNREIERVPYFGNLLSYIRSLGLPSATVLGEEKRGNEATRTARH